MTLTTRPPPQSKLTRRALILAAAAAGAAAMLGDLLATYPPWLDYGKQENATWNTPFRTSLPLTAEMHEIIRYATLAPSGHNTQPWKFTVTGTEIQIAPDYARRLPVVDPQERELWISIGCALENLDIAARSAGYHTEISYPAPGADYLTLHLRSISQHSSVPLAGAIPHRQNTRSLYDGRAVPLADMYQIDKTAPVPNISLLTLTEVKQKETVLEYIQAGNMAQYGAQPFVDELVTWLRFNTPEALRTMDGLSSKCSGSPEVPRWLGARFVTTGSAARQNETDIKNYRSASGVLVIASARDDKRCWIDTGRMYERLALTLTTLNIKTAFLNQPLEVVPLRAQLQSSLGLGSAQPQLLLRIGYADAMPRSLRRPVEQVLA